MTKLAVHFGSCGEVIALDTRGFSLLHTGRLGRVQIERATSIEFDDEYQSFKIVSPKSGAAPFAIVGFSYYADAVSFEQEWINLCLRKGIKDFFTTGGYEIACRVITANWSTFAIALQTPE